MWLGPKAMLSTGKAIQNIWRNQYHVFKSTAPKVFGGVPSLLPRNRLRQQPDLSELGICDPRDSHVLKVSTVLTVRRLGHMTLKENGAAKNNALCGTLREGDPCSWDDSLPPIEDGSLNPICHSYCYTKMPYDLFRKILAAWNQVNTEMIRMLLFI